MKKWRKTMRRYWNIQKLLVDLDRPDCARTQPDLRLFTETVARREFGSKWRDVLDELSHVIYFDESDSSEPIIREWATEDGLVSAIVMPRRHIARIAGLGGFRYLRIVDDAPNAV